MKVLSVGKASIGVAQSDLNRGVFRRVESIERKCGVDEGDLLQVLLTFEMESLRLKIENVCAEQM